MNIVVLGAGRVGGAIARDLAAGGKHRVTAVDASAKALGTLEPEGIRVVQADLADSSRVRSLAAEHDLVVGAGPAKLGFQTVRTVIEAGRNLVDISFFEEDPLPLDGLARERGVVVVVDCGVAPGLPNILFGHAAAGPGRVTRFVCYVGGLPATPSGPMRYKAPFAPADVIELYTRPARHVQGGRARTDDALAMRSLMEFPEVGTLEAFLTDGLRTMLREDVPEMREMTLRYPGHIDQVLLLRDLGFLDTEPREVGGHTIVPRELAESLLFPAWQFAPGEEDVTVLRVEIDVEDGGKRVRRTWDAIDRHDRASDTSSMARTTGYTCTAVAGLVAGGHFAKPGISAPEDVGRAPGCCERVLAHLAERQVALTEREEPAP